MSRALTEPEIQRYSRQILLHEVGGVGQLKLLSQPFALRGSGPALETCAAYVEGAGCPLCPPDRALRAEEVGYLFSHDRVGESLATVMGEGQVGDGASPVEDVQAGGPQRAPGELGEVPARFTTMGPRVALGAEAGRPVVAWAPEAGCADCFEAAVRRLSAPEPEDSVVLGSLGALVAVRLVLGEEPGAGAMVLGPQGSERWEMDRCERCR